MNGSFWSFAVTAGSVAGVALVLVAAVVLGVLAVRRNGRTRGTVALETLRAVTLVLLALTFFRPEYVRRTTRAEQPVVAVLTDASGSMRTEDVVPPGGGRPQSRAAWLAARRAEAFWQPLATAYRVEVADCAVAATNAGAESGTDLNAALEEALARHRNLRAVLLLSDGDWNTGSSPVSAATRLRLADIPIHAVGVGSDRFLPDLELVSVSAPAYGLMDEHISLPFTVQSHLARDVKTTLTLNSPSGVVATKEIVIPAMAQLQSTIILVPRGEGQTTYTLRVPVEKEEVLPDNNNRSFAMALRREVLKVLVVDAEPRWETRYIRNALARDPGVAVQSLLLHPRLGPGGGKDYLAAFPETREALSTYDVVFLGDVGLGAGGLPDQAPELLKGLVTQQGSGLVFLPGPHGRQAAFAKTVLGDLLPVELDPEHPEGFGINLESALTLTTRGEDHLLTMLAGTPAENATLWRSLPGFFWHAGVLKARPGAEVLAVHSSARNAHGRLPLLVARACGNGKTLFMGTDSAWRWRRGVEDLYHYRFWGQVVRWMAHQRHLAHEEGLRFFFNPETPVRGHRVFLHATVFDANGLPLQDGAVTATVTAPDGGTTDVPLTPEEGGWGVYAGAFVPRAGGKHVVTVQAAAAQRRVTTDMLVDSPRTERVGRPVRSDVLKELAAITGGAYVTHDALAQAVDRIRLLPERAPVEERLRLWCHPLWGALIVTLLGAYWVGRKLQGKI